VVWLGVRGVTCIGWSKFVCPEDLRAAFALFERYACAQSIQLSALVERGFWRKIILGVFGGASIVTVNLSAINLLSPLATGASGTIGAALLGQSARRLLEG
jgi:hypothetical protein